MVFAPDAQDSDTMIFRSLFMTCALLLFAGSVAFAETITLVADAWCPYNCQRGTESEGYIVDLAREIFEKAGIQVQYRVVAWERAIEDVRQGYSTGVIGVEKREADDLVFPDEEVGASTFAFYVRKGDPWYYKGLSSLDGKRVGLPVAYGLQPDMKEYFKRHWWSVKLQYVRGPFPSRLNVKKLVANRIDIALDDINVIRHTASVLKLEDEIRFAGAEEEFTKMYIAFSPAISNAKEYANILSQGIRELRQSGRLANILSKYGLRDWRHSEVHK